MFKIFRYIIAYWRSIWGWCPNCNSDAPELYDCPVCNYDTNSPFSKDKRKRYWERWKLLEQKR